VIEGRVMTGRGKRVEAKQAARTTIIHGLAMILAGLLWGLVVPATPFPRLALTAHIEFEVNGLLFIGLAAVLLTVRHNAGPNTLRALAGAVWLTWSMLAAEVANAWWGTKGILPIAAGQAGATGGASWQELIMSATHIVGGIVVIVAVAMVLAAVVKGGEEKAGA